MILNLLANAFYDIPKYQQACMCLKQSYPLPILPAG